jgi:hypothetical protein
MFILKIASMIFLLIAFNFLYNFSCDKFYIYKLTLETLKYEYFIGDEIEIIATISSKNYAPIRIYPSTIRLYEDREKSFKIDIIPDDTDDFARKLIYQFRGKIVPALPDDKIDVVKISPDHPFQMKIKGQIRQVSSGVIIFDFGRFGIFPRNKSKFRIWGYWRPIHPHPSDSLEDMTNDLEITVKQRV